MPAMSEIDRAVADKLAERDLRYTVGRRQIVAALRRADGPVTLPDLLGLSADLAQSSAYRNLSLMEEAGVVRRIVHRGDHAHFELDEALTEHHHHLICERCGQVADFTLGATLEQRLAGAFDDATAATGFVPTHHVVDVYGMCATCAAVDD